MTWNWNEVTGVELYDVKKRNRTKWRGVDREWKTGMTGSGEWIDWKMGDVEYGVVRSVAWKLIKARWNTKQMSAS